MISRYARTFAMACMAIASCTGVSAQGRSASIAIDDSQVFPENITSSANGTVWVGSMSKGNVYILRPHSRAAVLWVDGKHAGLQRVLGLYADEKRGNLWVCDGGRLPSENSAITDSKIVNFDIKTSQVRRVYPLEAGRSCNDFAVFKDGTVFATDFGTGSILVLKPGSATFSEWLRRSEIASADGIAVDDRSIIVGDIKSGLLYRIGLSRDLNPENLVGIKLSRQLAWPDGIRLYKPHVLLLAESAGRISRIDLSGDQGIVTTLRDGLGGNPAGVTTVGRKIYYVRAKFEYFLGHKIDPDPSVIDMFEIPQK